MRRSLSLGSVVKPEPHHDIGSVVGDARKRLAELPANHDEVHAHEDVDWNIVRGED